MKRNSTIQKRGRNWSFLLGFCALFVALCPLSAQDIHYTNFSYSPLNYNPALTGVFGGDTRFQASYKNQWAVVPVDYSTVSGAIDTKLGRNLLKHRPWSVGALFNYDISGDSRLNNAALQLSGAYQLKLSKKHFVGLGVQVGGHQRQFSQARLRYDNQYQNGVYDPKNPTNEPLFDNTVYYGDLSAGLNYHYQTTKLDKRTTVDAGVSLYHINKPQKAFRDGAVVKLEHRLAYSVNAAITLTKRVDLIVAGIFGSQGPHQEVVGDLGARLFLTRKNTSLLALELGAAFRNQDAIVPHIGLWYNQWKFATNFDINYSGFKTATVQNGGPEIHVQYIINKVRPLKYCPTCPTHL